MLGRYDSPESRAEYDRLIAEWEAGGRRPLPPPPAPEGVPAPPAFGTGCKPPGYRHHKPSGRATVELNGRTIYLGEYGSPESQAKYARLIAEWLVCGRRLPADPEAITVDEVMDAYQGFADIYYRKDGKPTSEPFAVEIAARPLRAFYGDTPAAEFGPLGLKAIRQQMVEAGLSRRYVNQQVGRIVRAFKWAVAEESRSPRRSTRPWRRSRGCGRTGRRPATPSRSGRSRTPTWMRPGRSRTPTWMRPCPASRPGSGP